MKFAILLVCIGLAVAAPHRYVRSADTPNINGTLIQLKNYANVAYWTELEIGTPPQKFKVALDTSSAMTFVPSADCDVKLPGCAGHETYKSFKSSSYIGIGAPWKYNTNPNIAGFLSVDKVALGNLSVPYQTFAEGVSLSSYALNQSQYDGVLGLGMESTDKPNNFMSNLVKSNQSLPIFSLWLNKDPSAELGGSLLLGAIDTTKSTGTQATLRLADSGTNGWVVQLSSISVATGNAINIQGKALVTPSTPFLSLQKYTADQLHTSYLGGRVISPGKYAFDCNKLDQVPNIKLRFDNSQYLDLASKDFITVTDSPMGKFCLSNIEGLPTTLPGDIEVVIGSVLLRQYYTIFDNNNAQGPRILFGTLKA